MIWGFWRRRRLGWPIRGRGSLSFMMSSECSCSRCLNCWAGTSTRMTRTCCVTIRPVIQKTNTDRRWPSGNATNAKLVRETELLQNYVAAIVSLYDEPCCRFQEIRGYQADSWDRSRRIIAKCEITAAGGPNRRCVVTNLSDSFSVRPLVLKVGALVESSVRRVWFHLSSTWPGRDLFSRVCSAVCGHFVRTRRAPGP